MALCNAMEEKYSEIRVLGKPALFHDLRIMRETLPKGVYLYEVRYAESGWPDPVQIARNIMVHYLGSIITREPIKLPPNGYLDIDADKDWGYVDGKRITIDEFKKKYPVRRKTELERQERS